jgi:hypothetical protein
MVTSTGGIPPGLVAVASVLQNAVYRIYEAKVDRPLHEVPRKVAQQAFDWFLQQREERIKQLVQFAREDGWKIKFDRSSLEDLHAWFYKQVADTRGTGDRPPGFVYSLCKDIGIFLGELIIANTSCLDWKLFVWGKKEMSYQRPVLMGFNVPNPKYYIDPDYVLSQYAHRIFAGGKFEAGLFKAIYDSAVAKSHSNEASS